MVQAQAADKLHAACDECRTRKLKCSGDTPRCVRCKKEDIECLYSPQKQMGRPRKRRRYSELLEEPAVPPITEGDVHRNTLNDPSPTFSAPNFGFTPPPDLPNLDYSNSSTENGVATPIQHDGDFTNNVEITPVQNIYFNFDPPIDPLTWNFQPLDPPDLTDNASLVQSNSGPCTCLSLVYLTLSDLQSMPSFSFPQVIIPLRKSMSALSDLIHCPRCPKDLFSTIQNIQSIVSLFKAIVERFNKVLLEVDAEASRLEQTNQKKSYRIGDNNPALFHLHTGNLDCPMGFNIDLEARDWKKLVKTALKTEVYGGGSNTRPLHDLLRESEVRQEKWHRDQSLWKEEMKHFPRQETDCDTTKGCEALGADHIRRAIDSLDWN